MSTHDATSQASFISQTAPWGTSGMGYGQLSILKFHIDIDAIDTLLGATQASGDTLQLWDVPAGTQILGCYIEQVTAATAPTAEIDVGDDTYADGYEDGLALDGSTDGGCQVGDDFGLLGGKLYVSTDTIDIVYAVANPTGAVFNIYFLVCFYNQ